MAKLRDNERREPRLERNDVVNLAAAEVVIECNELFDKYICYLKGAESNMDKAVDFISKNGLADVYSEMKGYLFL